MFLVSTSGLHAYMFTFVPEPNAYRAASSFNVRDSGISVPFANETTVVYLTSIIIIEVITKCTANVLKAAANEMTQINES